MLLLVYVNSHPSVETKWSYVCREDQKKNLCPLQAAMGCGSMVDPGNLA